MTAMSVEKASKQKDSEMKEARKETLTNKLMGKTKDQDHNNKELDATNKCAPVALRHTNLYRGWLL